MILIPQNYERYFKILLSKPEYDILDLIYADKEDEWEAYTIFNSSARISLVDLVDESEEEVMAFYFCVQGNTPDEINQFADAFNKQIIWAIVEQEEKYTRRM